jgi:replicative DNA helicase
MTQIKKVSPPEGEPTKNLPASSSTPSIATDNDKIRYLDEFVTEFEPWPEIDPIDSEPPLPMFPVEALPITIENYARALATSTQTPIDLAAVYSLAILATAAQGGQVEVQPDWTETLNLYILISMLTSDRKSPVVSALRKPIDDLEGELRKELAATIAGIHSDAAIAKAKLANIESQLAHPRLTGDDKLDLEADRDSLIHQIAEFDEHPSHHPLLTLDSVTPEALAAYLHAHDGVMAILSAEGGFFRDIAGRYNEKSAIEIALHGYSGETYKAHRKGSPPLEIKHVRLSLGITAQPIVLREALGSDEFVQRGLIGRFLVSTPALRTEPRLLHPAAIPKIVAAQYTSLIERLVRTNLAHPPQLTVSTDALDLLDTVRAAIEDRLLPGGEYSEDPMRGWAARLPGQIARIAGLIHIAKTGDTVVSVGSMKSAIEIGRYFTAHAARLFLTPEVSPVLRDCELLTRWILRKNLLTFSTRDALKSNQRRYRDASGAEVRLDTLAARGYVRRVRPPTPTTGRPPSAQWQVNPALFLS